MNPDKMLSEAEKPQELVEFLESYPAFKGVAKPMTARERALVEYAFNMGRAIPKPRQDAGRVEDALRKALLCAEAYTNYDNSESLKDRLKREVFTAHGWNGTEPLWAFVTKLRHHALSLEAKPQPDAGALEKIKKVALEAIKTDCQCGADEDSERSVSECWWHEILRLAQADAKREG